MKTQSVIARPAFAVLAAGVLSLGLFASATEGASYNVDERLTQLRIQYDGPCGTTGSPLTLQTAVPGSTGQLPPYIEVNGTVKDCFSTQAAPRGLLIENELFGYANVMASTTMEISPSYTGKVTVANLTGQSDHPQNFASSGQIFIGQELVNYSSVSATGFVISARGQTGGGPAVLHTSGSPLRAQGRLKLVSRAQPRYSATPGDTQPPESLTQAVPHAISTNVTSPMTFLTCRARLNQTVQSGDDPVTSRIRCYAAIEPGQAGPPAGYWADPYTGSVLSMSDHTYHDIMTGTMNGSGLMSLNVPCATYISGQLWFRITSDTAIDKTPYNTELGQFRILVYDNAMCTGSPIVTLGTGSNLTSIEIDQTPNPDPFDTDGDGCTDYDELGSNPEAGGLRDPFIAWDFFDPNGDGIIDLFEDIFGVSFLFGVSSPPATHDRGAHDGLLPAEGPWIVRGPDGTIDLFNDIFAVAFQFGHSCAEPP